MQQAYTQFSVLHKGVRECSPNATCSQFTGDSSLCRHRSTKTS